jgi:hypothetical protein
VTCYGELCMILIVCWLVWNSLWFRQTTGFIWDQIWWFDHFGGCYCTCASINWMVLLQLPLVQDSILNLSYVYLKQRFYFTKFILTTYSYMYRCVKSWNLNLDYVSGHILYVQFKNYRWLKVRLTWGVYFLAIYIL